MLAQDLLTRIYSVNWPGSLMLVLWAFGAKFSGGPTAPDPDIRIRINAPLLGLSDVDISTMSLTEKTRTTAHKVLFDTEPKRKEDYAYFEEIASETSTSNWTVIERARYHVQNQHSGVVVTFAENEFFGVIIPWTMDYTGNAASDDPHDVFLSPPSDVFALAEARATEAGLPGVGWKPVLNTILASHEETTSVTTKILNKSRYLFLNFAKFKTENPDVPTLVIEIKADWTSGPAKQTYGAGGYVGIYKKDVQDKEAFTQIPVDPTDVWPVVTGHDLFDPGPVNNSPEFFPPGPNTAGNHIRLPEASAEEAIATGETTKAPGLVRFTIDMETLQITSEQEFLFP